MIGSLVEVTGAVTGFVVYRVDTDRFLPKIHVTLEDLWRAWEASEGTCSCGGDWHRVTLLGLALPRPSWPGVACLRCRVLAP
jgi:hypothetical protein